LPYLKWVLSRLFYLTTIEGIEDLIVMRFNSVKGENFTSGAKAVNRSADQMFAASRESAPDFTGISKAAIASRTKERNAATQSKGLKDVANIKADNLIDRTKLKIKTEKDVADIKRPAKRMAGVVAGLGSISTAAMLAKDNREAKAERLQFKSERDAINAQMTEYQTASNEKMQEILKSLQKSRGTEGLTAPDAPKTDTPAAPKTVTPEVPLTPKTPAATDSFKPPVTSTGPVSSTPSRKAAFNQILESAKRVGGSNFPEVVAAQAMHETGWLSAPNSVYMSSGKTNPFGQTGDRGYGTIPREGFKDGWTLYPDIDTATADHIKLWHDTKNHSGNYNAFSTRDEGIKSVASAYSPNSDPENIRLGYTVTGYQKGVNSALREMGYIK